MAEVDVWVIGGPHVLKDWSGLGKEVELSYSRSLPNSFVHVNS